MGVRRVGDLEKKNVIEVEAIVLSNITSELPSSPVQFRPKWKHLKGLTLADPNFGVPGRIDLLLGADVFSQTVLNGRQKGPLGSLCVIETCFGWVLTGSSYGKNEPSQGICCLSTAPGDEDLR